MITEPTGRAVCTNAVVAICVVLVPGAAVGAVGTPVSAVLFSGAVLDVNAFAASVIDRPVMTLLPSQ
jgi:hypothetical protein